MISNQLNPDVWVDKYADYLYRYAITRVNNAEVAEDLVQETFLAGIKGVESFKGASNEKTWLTSILKRKVIDYYRKKSSHKELSFDTPDERFGMQRGMNDHWLDEKVPKQWNMQPDFEFENKEFNAILQACIRHLPANWASCFVLRVVEEMKSDEVCKELNISSSNLWVMLHRARLQLRDCIEKGWFN